MAYTGVNSNEITRDYLDSLLVEQRLIGSSLASAETVILGKKFATPIMNAAFSHTESAHPGYSAQMAEGFRMANALNWWGMSDDSEMEKIYATGADTVEIIKPFADEDMIRHRIDFALEHNAFAVGMDIDHAFNKKGEPDIIHGYPMEAKSVEQLKRYVGWAGKKPFVVKGVLSASDAEKCVQAGVSAIVVSHHHGIFDGAVPPLMVLPKIKEAAGGRLEIFVDCGMTSGLDAFKALAVGAKAVCASRTILDKTYSGGADAVCGEVNRMTSELRGFMERCGFASTSEINDSVLWKR